MQTVTPICAYHVAADGAATALEPGWPEIPKGGGYVWLHFDLKEPGLQGFLSRYLPPLALASLLQAETRPRCDAAPGGMILNLRGVNLNPGADPEDMVSLRMWLAEGLIVTSRTRKIWAADALRDRLAEGEGPASLGGFLDALTRGLTDRIERVSLDLEEQTDDLEEQLIEAPQNLPQQIASLRHAVIKLRRFVGPQREALAKLAAFDAGLIDESSRAHLKEVSNQATRCVEELDATRERLAAIQDSLDARHALAMGRNGYLLSVIAAIFLPLGFLTGLFGVNLAGMPGQAHPMAFLALTVMSIAIGVLLYLVFRHFKWL